MSDGSPLQMGLGVAAGVLASVPSLHRPRRY